jgi:rhodanese-related sulfurtransferase
MSAMAAQTLMDMGYNNVCNLTAGMKEWQAAGYELLDKGR